MRIRRTVFGFHPALEPIDDGSRAACGMADVGPFPAWVWVVGVLGLVALWAVSPSRRRMTT